MFLVGPRTRSRAVIQSRRETLADFLGRGRPLRGRFRSNSAQCRTARSSIDADVQAGVRAEKNS